MGVGRFLPSFSDVEASCFYWKSLESVLRAPLTSQWGGQGWSKGLAPEGVVLRLPTQHTLGAGCLRAGRLGARGWTDAQ